MVRELIWRKFKVRMNEVSVDRLIFHSSILADMSELSSMIIKSAVKVKRMG